ncbi:MAG: hypothetical protein K2M87_06505 [Muribaculaceae bacterium]|nr:hypothetical protein [Muribaculaceae bacterium]
MEDLEIMREQLSALKKRLDTQEIVNNNLMRRVMRSKASWLNILVKAEIWFLPILYLILAEICHLVGISQWYALTFLIMAGIDVYFDWKTVRISPRRFSEDSILQLKKFLLKQKKSRCIQTIIAFILSVTWLMCLFTAGNFKVARFMMPNLQNDDYLLTTIVIGIVSTIASAIVVLYLYLKMQHTNDDLIRDITELESENQNQ